MMLRLQIDITKPSIKPRKLTNIHPLAKCYEDKYCNKRASDLG